MGTWIINLLNVYAKLPDAGTAPTSISRHRHGADQGAQRRGGCGQHIGERHVDWFYRKRPDPPPARGKRRVTVS